MLKNIRKNKISASAQEQIKLFIIESGLKSGDMMPTEKMLEEQLGISRTSIREALRSLEAIGILESRHGVGRFLREFNYDAILNSLSYNIEVNVKDFREIIDVRIALESSFLEKNVPRFSPKDIEDLYSILERMEQGVQRQQDEQELISTHTEFHLKLYEHEENNLLMHLIRMFATIQRTLTILKKYRTSDREDFILVHRRLIEAVEAGDASLAKQRLVEHFGEVISWSNRHRDGKL